MPELRKPYLLFLGDCTDPSDAKTAYGLRDWCRGDVAGQFRLPGCKVDLDLPEMSPEQAAEAGVKSLVIGVAPVGGRLAEAWVDGVVAALQAGLDVVSGLHQRIDDVPAIGDAAAGSTGTIHHVRHGEQAFSAGDGTKRPGLRCLTFGTDCALGKKYTALAIAKELRARGVDADFRATGQTGIMIAGRGVAIDAVVADFIAGAAEWLSPANDPGHWDVIEGQGSLHSPAYAGVSLGLLHGSQPDALVLCHDPTRPHMVDLPHVPMPDPAEALDLAVTLARRTNPAVRPIGVSLNTSRLDDDEATSTMQRLADRLNLPVCDPMRGGVGSICDRLVAMGPGSASAVNTPKGVTA